MAFFVIDTVPGGGFAWTKTPGGSIAALMAATLARHALLVYAPTARPKITLVPLMETPTRADDDDQPPRDLMRVPF
ncbi:MAG TPA: hypothetical protein VN306_01200 [Mycobacterium sp.]|nr:hypothetical protein [Mycobacterium sp.]